MATTNYSLPTLESTALFDLVTDYNALSNATDAALANVAGLIPTETITEMQGQISNLQTTTGAQGTQITTLQSQVSTANDNVTALESALDTTNTYIGTLQTGLQGANTAIQALRTMMSPITVLSGLSASVGNSSISGNVFCNPAAKILIFSLSAKLTFNFTSGTNPRFTAFSQVLPPEYRPTQNRRIYVGSAMSGTAACNLQLDIDSKTGTITPNVGGINNVQSFSINGNGILMYDIPADANNS